MHTPRPQPVAIVFVHMGYSPYLAATMRCAKLTNPDAQCFMIGDAANKQVTEQSGWEHVAISDLGSPLHDRFLNCYKLLASPNHSDHFLPYDLTKFCLERYFFASTLAQRRGFQKFWMFDSDDIIAESLLPFQEALLARGARCTRMANNRALRGLMDATVLAEFCGFIVGLYSDPNFMAEKSQFYANSATFAAFTDMSAGALFPLSAPGCVHLADSVSGWHFDDCIVEPHGFEMTRLGHFTPLMMKRVRFDGHHFIGKGPNGPVKLATINGSCLAPQTFRWFAESLEARGQDRGRPGDIVSQRPWLIRELLYLAKVRLKRALIGRAA